MDTASGQDQFSAPNSIANITGFHTCHQAHFVNYEYWTGSLGAALGFQSADDRRDRPRAGRCHQASECATGAIATPLPCTGPHP